MLPQPRLVVPQVIVPVERIDRATLRALAYARSISSDVTAVGLMAPAEVETLRRHLRTSAGRIQIVNRRPGDLVRYLDERERDDPDRPITVVVSDIVPKRRWTYPLHDTTLRLKVRLLRRPNTIVVDVPVHV